MVILFAMLWKNFKERSKDDSANGVKYLTASLLLGALTVVIEILNDVIAKEDKKYYEKRNKPSHLKLVK